MILLTRFNGRPLVINTDLIKTVEETPETMITLLNGDRIVVKEAMSEVVRRAIEYGRQVRCFGVPPGDPAADCIT